MNRKTIETLRVGESASLSKRFMEADVAGFAAVSGDHNPAHMDEAYAKNTAFGARLVHGMLVGSLFSAILGTELPGLGSIYTHQTLKFTKPVYLGDTVTATVTVRELIPEKNRVVLDTVAVNQKGETVIVGEAVIMPPKGE